jgi:beta-glucosidase
LSAEVKVHSTQENVSVPDYRATAPMYYDLPAGDLDIPQDQFEALYGKKIPQLDVVTSRPFTRQSTLYDAKRTLVGKILIVILRKLIRKYVGTGSSDDENKNDDNMLQMIERMLLDFPFRSFGMMGFSEDIVTGILDLLNYKIFRGIRLIVKASRRT